MPRRRAPVPRRLHRCASRRAARATVEVFPVVPAVPAVPLVSVVSVVSVATSMRCAARPHVAYLRPEHGAIGYTAQRRYAQDRPFVGLFSTLLLPGGRRKSNPPVDDFLGVAALRRHVPAQHRKEST
jgi:hypothetical protein